MDGNNTYSGLIYSSGNAFLLQAIIYGLVIIFGIVGNSFVLFIYMVKMRRTQNEARYFIPILAGFDLLVCILAAAIVIGNYLPYIGVFNNVLCKATYYLLAFTLMTSNALLLIIAIQRYIKVCRPLGKQMGLFWRRFATVLVITISVLFSMPMLFISGATISTNTYSSINISLFSCSPADNHYPTFQVVHYLVMLALGFANLVATIGMYTPIMCAIYRHYKISNLNKKPTEDPYTMIIQGKEKDHAEIPSQTAKEGAPKIHVHGTGENDAELFPNNSGEIAIRCENVIPSNVNVQKKTKTPTTNFNVMFFCIILIYLISYSPTIVTTLLLSQNQVSVRPSNFPWIRFVIGFYVVNHAANPFVYAYFDMKLRQTILRLCKRKQSQ